MKIEIFIEGKACKRYNMKKVAIVAQGLGDGGAERVASILANDCQNTIQYYL